MKLKGHLQKMRVSHDACAQYELVVEEKPYALMEHMGEYITIKYLGNIHCMACGVKTKTSFNQGFCYKCFQALARNDRCVMSPELCHFAAGTCREPEWGLAHCMKPHVVYLAWSSGLKVGLTKPGQIPTRWLDQGASYAVVIAETDSRYHAGLVEDYLKQFYADRTQWRKMLTGEPLGVDLLAEAKQAVVRIKKSKLPSEVIDNISYPDLEVYGYNYPVDEIGPIKSLNLEKLGEVSGYILGIKGQYLMLDTGVINLRKYTQYEVEIEIKPFAPD